MSTGFWHDLRRRRVVRVVVGYVAVAYAVLEGADLILPRLGLPDRVLTALVVLSILGFPVVLVLSWVFDLSPDGIRRTRARDEPARGMPAVEDPGDSSARFGPTGSRAVRITALVVVTGLFAAGAWLWIPRAPGFETSAVDPNTLLVLPFDVRGGDEVAYLREGMVDLVSTKLDGVGELSVLDPSASLPRVAQMGAIPVEVAGLARLASELGAGRVLRGSVVWVAGRLQVRATVLGPALHDRIEAVVEGSSTELFGVVDELVATLVARGLIEQGTQLSSVEGLTTRSNEALRLYLTGVQNFRLGLGMQDTWEPLLAAVAIDSTFALASYWAGYAADYDEIEDPLPHYQRAMRHQDRLGPRDRMRLAGALAGAEGRHGDAIGLYEALVARYPDDLAGWLQLGEQVSHTGRWVGRTQADAREAYERAVALDPALAPAYYHLAVVAARAADTTALAEWIPRLESGGVDAITLAITRLALHTLQGDSAAARQAFDRLRIAEGELPPATMAGSMGELTGALAIHAPDAAMALMRNFAPAALTDTGRTVAARRLARAEAGAGRLEEAEAALRRVGASLGSVLDQDLAWLALHPASTSEARMEAAYRALGQRSPPTGSGEAAARNYLLGRLALRLGRPADVQRAREALQDYPDSDPQTTRFAGDLLAELEAEALLIAGDPAAGLARLQEAGYWTRGERWLGFPSPTYLDGRLPDRDPMFLRAELLRASGAEAEAIQWYRVAAEGVWYASPAGQVLAELGAGAPTPP